MWDPAVQHSSKIHYEARLHLSRTAAHSSRFASPVRPGTATTGPLAVLTAIVFGVLALAAVTGSALT